MDFGFSSPKSTKSFMHDQSTDKKLKHGLVSLSWQQSKNFIDIPKMIERIPGENFIGEYLTHACYELPVSFLTKEQLKKIPHFNRMSGRYRRLPGSLVRNMTGQQRAEPRDGASPDLDRPKNINYEKLLQGYEKLGHMKKLAVPFDMSKSKARDMNMLMQTDFYKNILYDNYKMQCEEMFSLSPRHHFSSGSSRKAYTAVGTKRNLNSRG